MRSVLVICMLFVCGCATTGAPRASLDQRAIPLPSFDYSSTLQGASNGRVIRLLDSRTIRELIRKDRDEAALPLTGRAKKVLFIAGAVVALYVLIDSQEDDDEDCGFTYGLPRPCDYPYSQ